MIFLKKLSFVLVLIIYKLNEQWKLPKSLLFQMCKISNNQLSE